MRIPRYQLGARWYETLSLERLLYRGGRLAAIELAAVRSGDRVLDVGCGTGLSFEPLVRSGSSVRVTGIDASPSMLRQAARLVAARRWPVRLILTDASDLTGLGAESFDVIVFCYSLSVVADWTQVWQRALGLLAPGGRIAVVDTAYPVGWRRVLYPLVWVLFAAGGVHPSRRVWTAVARDLDCVVERRLRGGHVRLAVGSHRAAGATSR